MTLQYLLLTELREVEEIDHNEKASSEEEEASFEEESFDKGIGSDSYR